ncbi:MAG: sialate O-acetylesterase, partial [Muribaculaceae bacterium]|nr:sialate O-acetylesterase [Muribaculaceae bacterium]
NQVYGHADAPFEGPNPVSASISAPGTITLTMENNAGVPEEITSFEVADLEGHFIPAKAKPQGDKIILTYDKNVTPTLLRYGWQPYSEGNLTNANGLPASTFKIEVR